MIGQRLVDIMLREGVDIPLKERDKVANTLQKAHESEMLHIIERNGEPIGFMAYIEKSQALFINYCFIYKAFRGRFNFISLRSYFREKYKNIRFNWRSKKRNRFASVS